MTRGPAPLLSALGQSSFVISEKPEAANLVKLSGNFLTATIIESLGEALALISRGGIGRKAYLEFLISTNVASVVHDRFLSLLARGGEQLDWSAVGGLAAADAGVDAALTRQLGTSAH